MRNRVGEYGRSLTYTTPGGICILVPAVPVNKRSENMASNLKRRDFRGFLLELPKKFQKFQIMKGVRIWL